jgi:hypothetical protein
VDVGRSLGRTLLVASPTGRERRPGRYGEPARSTKLEQQAFGQARSRRVSAYGPATNRANDPRSSVSTRVNAWESPRRSPSGSSPRLVKLRSRLYAAPLSHLVGLIRPGEVAVSAGAEDERSDG